MELRGGWGSLQISYRLYTHWSVQATPLQAALLLRVIYTNLLFAN